MQHPQHNKTTLGLLFLALIAFFAHTFANQFLATSSLDVTIYQFTKLIKLVLCLAIFIHWLFIRSSAVSLFRDNTFRRWQIGFILLIQSFDGMMYFYTSDPSIWQYVSTITLLITGLVFFQLYVSFLMKRLADTVVVTLVSFMFVLLIAYSMTSDITFHLSATAENITKLLAIIGVSLLFTISLIRAQYKMSNYSEFELIPLLMGFAGFFEVVGQQGYFLWWGAFIYQLLLIVAFGLFIFRITARSSIDWQMFKSGLDSSASAYFCSDMEGQIRFVNDTYKKILAIKPSTEIRNIKHPLYTHPLQSSVNNTLAKHNTWSGETVLTNNDGKIISVYAYFTMIELNGVLYQQGWFYDIHEKIILKENESVMLEKLERLSFSLMEKQEEERRYFAKELHDEIGQGLTLLKIQHQLPEPDRDLISTVLSELIAKVRNLSLNLRPAILDDMGLSSALSWLSDRQRQFSQLAITDNIDTKLPRFNDKLEISVFRIAQEAFTNIHKYSHADHVIISCNLDQEYLHLSIEDNGVGFDVNAKLNNAVKGQSLGLLSIKERAYLVNGLIDIESTPELGTKIVLRVPTESFKGEGA